MMLMSAIGTKRTCRVALHMSAFGVKRTCPSPASAHWVCSGGEESGSQISALGNDCTNGTL
jgi:hypothetical protein